MKSTIANLLLQINSINEKIKVIEKELQSNIKNNIIDTFLTDFIGFKSFQPNYDSKICTFKLIDLNTLDVGTILPTETLGLFNNNTLFFNVYTENINFSLNLHTLWIYKKDNVVTEIFYTKLIN
jgi:hypothetical protein